MREIKFRAFVKHLGQLAHVVSIDFLDNEVEIYLVDRDEIRKYQFGEDEIVLLQYTGLKDKNGKEIYEGDIVRCYGGAYWNGIYEYNVVEVVDIRDLNGIVHSENVEILGNIHENPELAWLVK